MTTDETETPSQPVPVPPGSVNPPPTSSSGEEGNATPALSQAHSAPAAESGSARPRIKIGTQRQGVVAPKLPARTQTVFTTEPLPEKRPPQAAKPEPAAEATAPPQSVEQTDVRNEAQSAP